MIKSLKSLFCEKLDGGDQAESSWNILASYEKYADKRFDEGYTTDDYIAFFNHRGYRTSTSFRKSKHTLRIYIDLLKEHGYIDDHNAEALQPIVLEDLCISDFRSVHQKVMEGAFLRIAKVGDNYTAYGLTVRNDAYGFHLAPEENRPVQTDKNTNTIAPVAFYRNISELNEAISTSLNASTVEDLDTYDPAVAALRMLWYGLTLTQITNILKADVKPNGVLVDDKLVPMDEDTIKHLNYYLMSEGSFRRCGHEKPIFIKYMDSPYLFRSNQSAKFTEEAVKSAIKKINAVLNGVFSLNTRVVAQSGMFHRAFIWECMNHRINFNDPKEMKMLFDVDSPSESRKSSIRKNYNTYRKLF